MPGVPLYGSGGLGWFSVAEAGSVCGSRGGAGILNREHLENLVGALAGNGSGDSKAEGGWLRIAAKLFFHEHVILLRRIVVRQEGTNKKRPDKAITSATNGEDPSRICTPVGWRRCL